MRHAVALFALLVASTASAHVGSPDIYHEGLAGPYRLLVTVRPPEVIPGVAEITVRAADSDVKALRMVPLPLGEGAATFAPTPDLADRLPGDPQSFVAHLWMMSAGSWQVRITADGPRGPGALAVPVAALPRRTRGMQLALGAMLTFMLALLGLGVVSIVGASVREAQLDPGAQPGTPERRRGRLFMAATAAVVAAALYGGRVWWDAEAADYDRYVYKSLEMDAAVDQNGRLTMTLRDPGWLRSRRLDDLAPDHGHLMHLFVVALPTLDRVWHLHPTETGAGAFSHPLPPMPKGRYQLYADVVHRTGLAETITATLDVPELSGRPLEGDDATGSGPAAAEPTRVTSPLSGGAKMVWLKDGAPLESRRATRFRFRVEDAAGHPVSNLELYMGMLGHAAFVSRDLSVFAHVHPTGSVPMAALAVAQPDDPHAGHTMPSSAALPAEVGFPFGLPAPGDYRIFVQIKRAGAIETGVFDATAR